MYFTLKNFVHTATYILEKQIDICAVSSWANNLVAKIIFNMETIFHYLLWKNT